MKCRKMFLAVFALATSILFAGCWGSSNSVTIQPAPPAVTGNIQSQVLGVDTSAGKPVVTFMLRDQNGAALNPVALKAEGGRVRFFIARIESDNSYKNYMSDNLAAAKQNPSYDDKGTFANVSDGVYRYTFSKSIDNASQTLGGIVVTGSESKTHTVAIQLSRAILTNTGKPDTLVANPLLNFRPDGGAVTVTREIVATSNCNECHYKLGIHGGTRQEIGLCILCHYPGVVDANGVSVDLKSMVHRIHMGKNLASNLAGGDYAVNGNSFKTLGYPFWSQDDLITKTPADCVKCHKAGKTMAGIAFGADVNRYKSAPTYNKCTTCHNTMVFTSGVTTIVVDNNGTPATVAAINHATTYGAGDIDVSLANADNSAKCAGCHDVTAFANTDYSVNSVKGAHTILERSSIYTGVNYQIIRVDNAIAGRAPVITFKVTTDTGTSINPTDNTSSFSFQLGYMPATSRDYSNALMGAEAQPIRRRPRQDAPVATSNGDGTWTYPFTSLIPAGDNNGTIVIGMEGAVTYTLPLSARRGTIAANKSVAGKAIQAYFNAATGAAISDPAQQRRISVDAAKCNGCHGRLSFHGGGRALNVQECVICHNPEAVAGASDPFNLKDLVHRAHTGENLDNSIRLTYFSGRFKDMRYPQDRMNCLACHVDSNPISFGLPLPAGVKGTVIDNAVTPTRVGPITSACLSCHSDATFAFSATHAANQTSGTTELCVQCHTTGLLIGPDFAHQPVRAFPTP